MKQSRFMQEQIIGVLKEHPAGAEAAGPCRKRGISDATVYTWRSKYGAMKVSDALSNGRPFRALVVVENFNGRFRDECLNKHLFSSLVAARRIIEAWRIDYNTERPHTSLDEFTPAVSATRPDQEHTRSGVCS